MPRLSERQRLIHDIVDVMAVAIMDEENDELLNDNLTADSDLLLISDVDDVSEMLQLVQSSRYLVDRERAISATQFHADIFLQTTPNSRFRTRARMDKDSFKLVRSRTTRFSTIALLSPKRQSGSSSLLRWIGLDTTALVHRSTAPRSCGASAKEPLMIILTALSRL
ncbi:hypothetical protein PF005_g6935 [Phytophthora fragariae]|uniref:Uncharacterized protein n=1 Tax=Phytophthora fragariae TaxID=53985 RepID=A0A6A3SSU3_9STRA|nr:hypothetical protein PF003_g16587 [Phytophthora fragariae]KAE8942522.1 hypothetical protein PF009_g7727 [Phytophthora fragariae]KAE9004610.1 hypothetical protein PF011_g12369 [Phytophthora fragariae]KAE9123136.1 hypothetical protein PF007_g7173 [Phytophthora fragariae]KAE9123851.1 hypothetical protein PF010_g6227 [Phytophthora fragariae]